jgi:phosphoribosyl 1,2-cyclic phosphodiesterase
MKIISLASGSSGNAYAVKSSGDVFLIECGLPEKKLKEKLWDNDIMISDISICLISHKHKDHSQSAEFLANNGVDIYYPHTKSEDKEFNSSFKGVKRQDRLNYLRPRKTTRTGGFRLVGYELEHDGIPNFAYLILDTRSKERLFYATDTMYIKYKPESVNYWLIEVNFQDKYLEEAIKEGRMDRDNMRRIKRSHMSLATAKAFFSKQDLSDTREIWLLHLSDRNSNPTEVREEIQKATGKEVYLA